MPEPEAVLAVAAVSHPGQKRERNEDAYGYELTPYGGVFVVADGMGGHAHGDRAARMAVETIIGALKDREPSPALLADALEEANRRIYQAAKSGRAEGMGTTATALVVDFPYALIGHVGDSRAYLFRNGLLVQLTQDHSWVADRVREGLLRPEDARGHRWKNVITNALGTFPEVEVDLLGLRLKAGDLLLLSTDGLHGVLGEEAIARVLAGEQNLKQAVNRLVELANAWGGPDNITAIAVRAERVPAGGEKPYALMLSGDQPVYIRARSGDTELVLPKRPPKYRLSELVLLVLWLLLLAYVLLSQRP